MKKIICILLIFLLSISLTGCINDKDQLIGTWEGNWKIGQDLFVMKGKYWITFFSDDTCTISYENVAITPISDIFNKWALKDNNIVFKTSNEDVVMTFSYSFVNSTNLRLINIKNGEILNLTLQK